jgi:hypothetical protein
LYANIKPWRKIMATVTPQMVEKSYEIAKKVYKGEFIVGK